MTALSRPPSAIAPMFPLGVRSHYSLMEATASPEALCARAAHLGYPGLALTDRDSLMGLPDFLAACRRYRLRPLIGAEVTSPHRPESVLCLVKNAEGYANLCRLISRRRTSAARKETFSLTRELITHGTGLLILARSRETARPLLAAGLDLALDLGNRPTQAGRRLRHWAGKKGLVATPVPASVMAHHDELPLLHLLRAIDTNSRFQPPGRRWSPSAPPAALEDAATYTRRFAVWPEVIPASCEIASRCTFTGPDFGIVMPPWRVAGERAGPFLRRAAHRGARRRYGVPLPATVRRRLDHELGIIDSMGFSSYFLVVRDIVARALDPEQGREQTVRICGRGSGAASLVAYCLGITNICPLRHNLYFERFLNPGRRDPPDIDIDFAWDERDRILAQVLDHYGDHSAMVSTTIRFQPRMAIRETARAFGLPPGEISRITKKIPRFHTHATSSLLHRMKKLPGLDHQSPAAPWPRIIHLATRLTGLPRHLSVHPGGVVITPRPVSDYVPVEPAAKGIPIIQWDKDGAEEAGLVKIDLLGNRSLGVIRDCIASIRKNGRGFDESRWRPEEDPATKGAVAAGRTMGCFYIESPAMRLLQQKAGCGDFEQLVLQSSIIRPAANDYIREYVRRLHGGAWKHLHPRLAGVLDETFGLMVYQEDVARVAVVMAGFSHARADGLRKVISKKDRERRLRDYRREFDAGCAARGVDTATRKQLWRMMMSFDGYSFCKPHSASYARVSFQAAYLKTRFPAEFMAAVISNQGGYYSTFAYVSEARRLGLRILPPCVNRSDIRWQGRDRTIRVGLMAIAHLSGELCRRIIDERKRLPFSSAVDFFRRVQPPDDQCRALIHAGALDRLGQPTARSVLLWEYARFRALAATRNQSPLFPVALPPAPRLPPDKPRERLRQQYRILGFLCSSHPLALCPAKPANRVRAREISRHRARRITFVGLLITGKLISTKTGEVMEFLTFEDETGLLETTFFPRVYRRYAHLLITGRPYVLQGLVEEEYGVCTLTVERLRPLVIASRVTGNKKYAKMRQEKGKRSYAGCRQ